MIDKIPEIHRGKPSSIAAAAIYLTAKKEGLWLTQDDIALSLYITSSGILRAIRL
jgi:transcription initiation factor TFIIIB Brf1 subunit/transcription initiation factor TFIIB